MSQWSISAEANKILLRMMLKEGLVDNMSTSELEAELARLTREDMCPIAWLARSGRSDETKTLNTLSQKLKIPLLHFDRSTLESASHLMKSPPTDAIDCAGWQSLHAVPVELSGDRLIVAFANPLDMQAIKLIGQTLKMEVRPALAREESIQEALGIHHSASTDNDLAALVERNSEGMRLETGGLEDLGRFETTLTSSDLSAPPIVRLVNKVIADSIQRRASDIHITPEREILAVAIRTDGIMHPLFDIPVRIQGAIVSRIKLLSGMDIAERRRPQDGRMRVKASSGTKDLRVSTVPTAFGESVVIRILSSDIAKLTFSTLGVDDYTKRMLDPALKSSARVILVTGPTGSGKTSTLYAALMMLHDGSNSIVTVEDPIEYKIEGINQIQVNSKIGVTFAEGLRSILRQDPDVIMVGEIRDLETAEIAAQAAQTGHLVLSTLHTNSAASAFIRLRDIGLPAYIVASSVGTVLAQRLVRRLCVHCATPGSTFSSELLEELGVDRDRVKQAKGCPECSDSGYLGRIGIYSVLEVTEGVREAIRAERGELEIEQIARSNGFLSLLESGVSLVNTGTTSLEELERGLGSLELLASELRGHVSSGSRTSEAAGMKGAPGHPMQKRRILLVEDDENTRTVLSMLLKREMFEVVEAEDGLDALEKVFEQTPELILLDMMMPRMGGIEFLQRLRKDKRARDIPVLMLTAADAEENEIISLDGGADDFVSKASDSRVMLARVHRLLERGL